MKLVKGAGLVKKVTTRADHSIDLIINIGELGHEELAFLFSFGGSSIYFLVGEQPITGENMPDISTVIDKDSGEKSPSHRLRNVLFVYWKKNLQAKHKEFDTYYRIAINRIIEKFKDKLI